MFVVGQERPMAVNESLEHLDDVGLVVPATWAISALDRWSFVRTGTKGEGGSWRRLLALLTERLAMPAAWYLVWENHVTGPLAQRSRMLVARRAQEGWAVFESGGLVIARAPARDFADGVFGPRGWDPVQGVPILYAGETLPTTVTLCAPPLRATIGMTPRLGRLVPSASLLGWLAKRRGVLFYGRRDALGREGMVGIGTLPLPVGTLADVGLIRDRLDGSHAPAVWQLPADVSEVSPA